MELILRLKNENFDIHYFLPEHLLSDIIFDYYDEDDVVIKWLSPNTFSLNFKFGITEFVILENGILNIDNSNKWLLSKDLNEIISLNDVPISNLTISKSLDEEERINKNKVIEEYDKNKLSVYKDIIPKYLETIYNLSNCIIDKNDLQQVIDSFSKHLGYDYHEIISVKVKK